MDDKQRIAMEVFTELRKQTSIDDDAVSKLEALGYFSAPASTRFHLSEPGGLVRHSINVALTLSDFTCKFKLSWGRRESPILVGLFHDLCKHDCYIAAGSKYVWNRRSAPGHGDKSVKLADDIIKLTEEEKLCIRWHMGYSVPGDKDHSGNGYSEAKVLNNNVMFTHWADDYASSVIEKDYV